MVWTSCAIVGERTVASVTAPGGVVRRATEVRIEMPEPSIAWASFCAAVFAGSEEKPAAVEVLYPELKSRPERGPM